MAQNIRVLKVISIVQLVMAVTFFTLGMSDRFQVRHIYTSFLFTPCWIAALVSTVLRCNHDPWIHVSFKTVSSSFLKTFNQVKTSKFLKDRLKCPWPYSINNTRYDSSWESVYPQLNYLVRRCSPRYSRMVIFSLYSVIEANSNEITG